MSCKDAFHRLLVGGFVGSLMVVPAVAGSFDMGGLIGGIMQGAIQANQQQQLLDRQQQLQRLEYEQSLRRQPLTPPLSLPPTSEESSVTRSPGLYAIDGHALGDVVHPESLSADFKCYPSEQFPGFQWCRSSKPVKDALTATAMVLSPTDTVVYNSKFFQSVIFQPGALAGELDRLSGQFQEQAHILRRPAAANDFNALIATWGALTLTAVDVPTATALANGQSVAVGIMVDFLGDPRASAKRGLPVYRLSGGAGYYWVTRYDRTGRGNLRYGAADPSALNVTPPKPNGPATPATVAALPQPDPMRSVVATSSTASSPGPAIGQPPVQVATLSNTGIAKAVANPLSADVPNQGRRVALVIGNSAYRSVPPLENPRRDAEAIAESLKSAGFDSVALVEDATLDEMKKALRDFQVQSDTADWAMVYYAGHGLEVDRENYLIPIDARLASDRDAVDEAVTLHYVLDKMRDAKKLHLVILDACRENPFQASMRRELSARGGARGLARYEPRIANELVVYAAKDGEQAQDGDNDNHSPFARSLLARLAMPHVEINKLFRLVTADVLESTANQQQPFVYGSTPGVEDFYFRAQ